MTTRLYVFTAAAVVFAAFVGYAFGRYRVYSFQNRGEALLTRSLQRHFEAPNHHLMNHVTLRVQDGTTQVDHILVSRFGVFVIETKDYQGWLFGNTRQSKWTQVLYRRKSRFQNPLFQNFKHLRAVQEILDFLPADSVKPVVVFTGSAIFKTETPRGVFSIAGFIDYLRAQTQEVLSLNRVQFCVGRLESVRLALTRKTDVEHVESLRRRYGSAN